MLLGYGGFAVHEIVTVFWIVIGPCGFSAISRSFLPHRGSSFDIGVGVELHRGFHTFCSFESSPRTVNQASRPSTVQTRDAFLSIGPDDFLGYELPEIAVKARLRTPRAAVRMSISWSLWFKCRGMHHYPVTSWQHPIRRGNFYPGFILHQRLTWNSGGWRHVLGTCPHFIVSRSDPSTRELSSKSQSSFGIVAPKVKLWAHQNGSSVT
ncbi:hypothetical protein V8F33_005220 [Rhypophila sp. PSN 637]